jgi:hypothetical protein
MINQTYYPPSNIPKAIATIKTIDNEIKIHPRNTKLGMNVKKMPIKSMIIMKLKIFHSTIIYSSDFTTYK